MNKADIGDIRAVIHAKLVARELPSETPVKCWVGNGTEQLCVGCDMPISPEAREYEVDLPGTTRHPGRTLAFHQGCLGIWHEERTRLSVVEGHA